MPVAPGKSVMRYEIFRNRNATDEAFTVISDMYKRIMSEDKELCANSQKNLNRGVFVNGEMHPEMEKGPLFFQQKVREVVTDHYKKEQQVDGQIWPAQRSVPKTAAASQSDAKFCSAVDCCSKEKACETKALDEAIAF